MIIHTDYLIVGLSAAGLHAAQTLRRLDHDASITAIDAQQTIYNKCFFTSFNSGIKKLEDLQLRKNEWFIQERINRYSSYIKYIDPQKRYVLDSENNQFNYSKLLLALGTRPKVLHLGNETLLNYHSVHDAQKLDDILQTKKPSTAIIIGGGLNGIELAHLLYKKNLQVTLLEQHSYLISSAFSRQAQEWLLAYYASRIHIRLNTNVLTIHSTDNLNLVQTNNDTYTADLVIDCRGIEPNTQWIGNKLELDSKSYILVDDSQRTSVSTIYAAGDCARYKNSQPNSNLWTDAALQGIHAAYSMLNISHPTPPVTDGGDTKFPDFPIYWRGKFAPDFEILVEKNDTRYREIWRDTQQKLRGFILIGTLKDAGELTQQFLRD